MGGFGFSSVLPRDRSSSRSPGAMGIPEVGGGKPPGVSGVPLVKERRGAVRRFSPARFRTSVVVGSAFGPVKRSVDVSSAGRSRLAVVVITVFVPVFISESKQCV